MLCKLYISLIGVLGMSDDQVVGKLEEIKALLKILAIQEFQKLRTSLLSTRNKEKVFELCTGSNEMSEIAKKSNISSEAVRLTIRDFENAGIVITRKKGAKAYPKKVL